MEDYLPGKIIDNLDDLREIIETVRSGHTPEAGKTYPLKQKMTDAKIAFQKMIKSYCLLLEERNNLKEMEEINGNLGRQLKEFDYEIMDLKKQLENKNPAQKESYAEITKQKQKDHTFVIKQKDLDADSVWQTFKLVVKPGEQKIRVKNHKKRQDGGLVVKTASIEDELKIKEAFKANNLTVDFDEQPDKPFRLVLKSIPVDLNKEEMCNSTK